MSKDRLFLAAACAAVFLFSAPLFGLPTGAPPGATGSEFIEGSSGRFCGQSGCHEIEANIGPGSLEVLVNGGPIEEYRYTPGEVVDLIVRVGQTGQRRFGFQLTARAASDACATAGDLMADEGEVQISPPVTTLNCSNVVYATHNPAKFVDDQAEFLLRWTAPASDVGEVVFGAAANAANGDNAHGGDCPGDGDCIYTREFRVQPEPSAGPPQPMISENGVVNGASFQPGFAPNAFASIFGTDLADGTVTWDGSFVDDLAPTEVGGTSVMVNGRPAFVSLASPGQLNIVLPDDDDRGPVSVEVTTAGGTSTAATIDLAEAAPAFFLFAAPADPPATFVAAIQNDGSNLVGPADLFGETPTDPPFAPAQPGDIVQLFYTGGGPFDPPLETGRVGGNGTAAANPMRVFVGETEAEVFFSGASGFVGLYQATIRVPMVEAGQVPLRGEVAGVSTQDGAFIAVGEE